MKIGLLGSGAMGKRHREAARELPQLHMVTRTTPPFNAVSPTDRPALLAAMLGDPSIQAIDICLPTPLHAPVARAALAAGRHVLCEKPMALTLEDGAHMIAAAHAAGRVLMIAQVLRFSPAYRLLAHMARTQPFGPVLSARFTRESAIPDWAPWLTQPAESGGAVLDLLIHDLDQALALCGRPTYITAAPLISPDTLHCQLDCAGLPITIEGGWFPDGRPFTMGFDVQFAEARLSYRATAGEVDRCLLERAGMAPRPLPLAAADPYREQLLYFAECATQQVPPLECPPEESLAAVELALTVCELARSSPGVSTPYSTVTR